MRDRYHDQLEQVSADLVAMATMVGSAMSQATTALLEADLTLAERVIRADEEIDELACEVEVDCYQLAVLQQPVAADLRMVVAALQIAASLERMGDLAAHVAKQTRINLPRAAVPPGLHPSFRRMGHVAEVVVGQVGSVISSRDLTLVADIARADEDMDALHRDLFAAVLSPTWDLGVEQAISTTLLSRFYERYADHAVTIAKRVMYVVTGEPYRTIDPDRGLVGG